MGVSFLVIILLGGLFLGPGLISAMIAHYKGYRPWFWILSFGLLGMLIVLIIPSLATAATPEQREKWESRADWTGGILSSLTFMMTFVVVAFAVLFFVGVAAPLRVKPGPVLVAPTTASPTMEDVEIEGESMQMKSDEKGAEPQSNSKPE